MKRTAVLILTVLLLLLCACGGKTEKTSVDIPIAEDGNYTGFSNIPENDTPELAAARGCMVIVSSLQEVGGEVTGEKHWESFLQTTEDGEDACLRVVHFVDGNGYYEDLYCKDGRYYLYGSNHELGLTVSSFQYLRRLDGTFGSDNGPHSVYVLTDSLELTHDDVTWSFLSSSFETVTDIPFIWLGFTVYLD